MRTPCSLWPPCPALHGRNKQAKRCYTLDRKCKQKRSNCRHLRRKFLPSLPTLANSQVGSASIPRVGSKFGVLCTQLCQEGPRLMTPPELPCSGLRKPCLYAWQSLSTCQDPDQGLHAGFPWACLPLCRAPWPASLTFPKTSCSPSSLSGRSPPGLTDLSKQRWWIRLDPASHSFS